MNIPYIIIKNKIRRDILPGANDYIYEFFDNLATENKSTKTIKQYAYDVRYFFDYIIQRNENIDTYNDITINIINSLTKQDIKDYMDHLCEFYKDGRRYENGARMRRRRLSSLCTFMQYLCTWKSLESNFAKCVTPPKVNKVKKPRLSDNEVTNMLYNIETGNGLSKWSKTYSERTKLRDIAIITTLSYTGIRVSELEGLDIDDIDYAQKTIKVTRKGGNEDIVVVNNEVLSAISDYIENERFGEDLGERALFLSTRHGESRRLTSRSIERLVKKYACVTTNKNVTPHTFRYTFGTKLYNETGDINLVADALGHEDIHTTASIYVEIDDEHKEIIRNMSYATD